MRVEHQHVIKIPIDELRGIIRQQFGIELAGIDPSLEAGNIVFTLDMIDQNVETYPNTTVSIVAKSDVPSKRKRKRKRNRIRTKGWNIVAKIRNSDGLVANIYEPLVKGLDGKELSRSEQYTLVRHILTSNGNNPSSDSINYFLNNTLEYLHQRGREEQRVKEL